MNFIKTLVLTFSYPQMRQQWFSGCIFPLGQLESLKGNCPQPASAVSLNVSTNFMTSYRITKFDPKRRNDQGFYLDNSEWTSISDIGKTEYNNVTYEEYEKIENAYVDAVMLILKDINLNFLTVDSLELYATKKDFKKDEKTGRLKNINFDFDIDIKSLKNGVQLDSTQIEKVIRLILRETVWMLLINDDFEVRFGYDYYMFVKTTNLKQSTIKQIEKNGLFVEAGIGPIEYIIVDKDGNEI